MGGAGALVHLGEILAYVYGIWLYWINSCAAAEVAAVMVDHVVNRRRCLSEGLRYLCTSSVVARHHA